MASMAVQSVSVEGRILCTNEGIILLSEPGGHRRLLSPSIVRMSILYTYLPTTSTAKRTWGQKTKTRVLCLDESFFQIPIVIL